MVPVRDTHGADDNTEVPGGNFAEGMIDGNREGGCSRWEAGTCPALYLCLLVLSFN